MNAENKKMIFDHFNTIDPIVAVQNHINWYKKTGHKTMNYGMKQFMVHHKDQNEINYDEFEYDTFTFLSPCIFDDLNHFNDDLGPCKATEEFESKFINEICRIYPKMKFIIEERRPDILNSN